MSEADAAFDALADEFFSVWFRYHPDVAAEAGVGGFERLLPAQSDDEVSALGGWLESLIVALEELDYGSLDAGRRIDLQLMFSAARVEHEELLEHDWRHRDPLRYLPVGEIFQLTLRQPEDIRDALAGLMRQVPLYLRRAQTLLRSMAELIAPESLAAAVDEAERGRCYLRELTASFWLRRHCHGWSEIEGLVDGACDAFAAYGESLRGEIAERAAGRLACGEEHLRFLLRHRHFMELDTDSVRSLLGEELARADAELADACADMGLTPDGALSHLDASVVDAGRRLEICRSEAGRLEGFLRQTGLFAIPDAPLRISERPACPRPLRFGADYVPDRTKGAGTFFLGEASGEGRGESLAALRGRCLDKTWGGAHLLAFAAGEAGWRLPRRLCGGASLVDGWRLYLRERLDDLGYLEPDDRLLALLQRQWAIRRALLDLDLHRGAVDGDQALAGLEGIPGADRVSLARLARRPGDALAAVLGWLAIARARDLAMRREGGDFTESGFNDRLLSQGRIPVPLIIGAELGQDAWQDIGGGLGI
jgi:uncharacterized protein (DUF885 family)